jgi:hypothetical protein
VPRHSKLERVRRRSTRGEFSAAANCDFSSRAPRSCRIILDLRPVESGRDIGSKAQRQCECLRIEVLQFCPASHGDAACVDVSSDGEWLAPVNGAAGRGNQLQDISAAKFLIKCTLDCLDLPRMRRTRLSSLVFSRAV